MIYRLRVFKADEEFFNVVGEYTVLGNLISQWSRSFKENATAMMDDNGEMESVNFEANLSEMVACHRRFGGAYDAFRDVSRQPHRTLRYVDIRDGYTLSLEKIDLNL